MKVFIGEYGRVIVLTIAAVWLSSYMFGHSGSGFLGQLQKAGPVGNVNESSSFDTLRDISKRRPPEFTLKVKKLRTGVKYNLLDTAFFQIEAKDADGNLPAVSVVKVISPAGEEITASLEQARLVPDMPGAYVVTYEAFDAHMGAAGKTTVKSYRLIAA